MFTYCIKSILCASVLAVSLIGFTQDGAASELDSRYIRTWNGTWLSGMTSGKAILNVSEIGGQFSLTAIPSFGSDPAPISKIKSSEKQLEFQTVGADGRVMRVELKLSGDQGKLKGKAYYEGLHMEVELSRAQ